MEKNEKSYTIMKNKTKQLDKLFKKWYLEQKKSDIENNKHFSVDGLIKEDDENCIVLFVLSEPHSENDHEYNPNFWFRRIWEDYNELYYSSDRIGKTSITKYKKRIELYAKSLGVTEPPHGIAVMDMKKCGGGSNLTKDFDKYVDAFAGYIKNQIEILDPQYIVACGSSVYNALQRIGLDDKTTSKIIKTYHLNARNSNSNFEFNKLL